MYTHILTTKRNYVSFYSHIFYVYPYFNHKKKLCEQQDTYFLYYHLNQNKPQSQAKKKKKNDMHFNKLSELC